MLTNRLALPQPVVDAVTNDPYSKGASDISVTQLIQPPYQRKLRESTEVIEDVADRIWSLVGQVGHGVLERAYPQVYTKDARKLSMTEMYAKYGVVAEHRLFTKVAGWTVSGQFDLLEKGKLQDYKFTSVWSTVGETKTEWIAQLNLLRLLAIRHGIEVNELGILAILRDWAKGKAKTAGYPKHQIASIKIPVWPIEQTEAYLLERVLAHQAADPPPCTDSERWKKNDIFAVMRAGRKAAVRRHETYQSAAEQVTSLCAANTTGKSVPIYTIQQRPGGYTRCMEYCSVSHNCPELQKDVEF